MAADTSLEIREQNIIKNGTFSFSDAKVILTGGINDYKTVAGLWEELFDGTSGTFIGEKQ